MMSYSDFSVQEFSIILFTVSGYLLVLFVKHLFLQKLLTLMFTLTLKSTVFIWLNNYTDYISWLAC